MGSGYPTTELLASLPFATSWFGEINGVSMTILIVAIAILGFTLISRLRQRPAQRANNPILEGANLPTFRHSLPSLGMELTRARRYECDLTVLVVKLDENRLLNQQRLLLGQGEDQEDSLELRQALPIALLHVGSILRDCLRQSDLTTCDPAANRYVVLLPETDRAEGQQAAGRIRKLIFDGAGIRVRIGSADFPKDGMVIDDLVKIATTDSDQDNIREISELRKMHALANSGHDTPPSSQADHESTSG